MTPTPIDDESYRVSREALDVTAAAVGATGRRVLTQGVELTDPDAVEDSVAATVDAFGRIDVCCNLSGGTGPELGNGSLLKLDPASWTAALDANLTTVWLGARACARRMVEQGDGGAIVSLSSSAGVIGEPGFGAFSAARGGVLRLTEVLATELAPHGIRANTVCPLGVSPAAGGGNPGLERGDRHPARDAGRLGPHHHPARPDADARRDRGGDRVPGQRRGQLRERAGDHRGGRRARLSDAAWGRVSAS